MEYASLVHYVLYHFDGGGVDVRSFHFRADTDADTGERGGGPGHLVVLLRLRSLRVTVQDIGL